MPKTDKVLYAGRTRVPGAARVRLRATRGPTVLSSPRQVGRLLHQFRAALRRRWPSCFIGAIGNAGAKREVVLLKSITVTAEVDLAKTGNTYFLQTSRNVSLPLAPQRRSKSPTRDIRALLLESHAREYQCRKQTRLSASAFVA